MESGVSESEEKLTPEALEQKRDRILASLKLGAQSPGFKAARKALNALINDLSKR